MKASICGSILLLSCTAALAQAPRETVKASVNGKTVSIEYGRPSLKGRSFQEMTRQLPADRMWRAGSEQVTTLTTEGDIMIGGQKIPAGRYSLYLHIPEDSNPSLAVNRTLGQPLIKIWDQAPDALKNEPWPHFSYEEEIKSDEVAWIPLNKQTGGNVDLFTIAFKSNSMGAALSFSWGDQLWTVPVTAGRAEGSE